MAFVIAHRGASAGAPDNSIEAFELAIAAGADAIEFDVRRTADDQLVAFHDAHVNGAPVGERTRKEITALTGSRPPLLEEVVALAHGRIGLDVELKEDGYVDRVLATLDGFDTTRLIITSFLDGVIGQIDAVPTGLLVGTARPEHGLRTRVSELFPVERARACGATALGLHVLLAELGALQRAHDAGLAAYVWTVNDDKRLRKLLADERVTGVITDVPARALELRG